MLGRDSVLFLDRSINRRGRGVLLQHCSQAPWQNRCQVRVGSRWDCSVVGEMAMFRYPRPMLVLGLFVRSVTRITSPLKNRRYAVRYEEPLLIPLRRIDRHYLDTE